MSQTLNTFMQEYFNLHKLLKDHFYPGPGGGVSLDIDCQAIAHPCEKVMGLFFQNQILVICQGINRLCLICIKRFAGKLKEC